MRMPVALMFLLASSAITCFIEREARADVHQKFDAQQEHVAPLMLGSTLDSMEPEWRDGFLFIAHAVTQYIGISIDRSNKTSATEANGKTKTWTSIISESDGTKTEITIDTSEHLTVKSTRVDNTLVNVRFERPFLPADENYLMTLPRKISSRQSTDGRWLIVTVQKTTGTERTFMYNCREPSLSWTRDSGTAYSSTQIGCSRLERGERVPQFGIVTFQKGQAARDFVWITWREDGRVPFYAALSKADKAVPGRLIAWDGDGKTLANCQVANLGEPHLMLRAAIASLDILQLDTLLMSSESRLRLNSTFDIQSKRTSTSMLNSMAELAAWSDRFERATPDDLGFLYPWGESKVIQTQRNEDREYRIISENPDSAWTFFYNKTSDKLKRAETENIALYFDQVSGTRLIGGRESSGQEQWLVNFYPGKVWPRIALSATPERPPNCLARGKFYVWSPTGSVVLEQETTSPTPISAIVQRIETALTSDQRSAIGWRGAKETEFLLGTY